MSQQLRTLSDPAEGLDSAPSTPFWQLTPLPEDVMPSSGLCRHQAGKQTNKQTNKSQKEKKKYPYTQNKNEHMFKYEL